MKNLAKLFGLGEDKSDVSDKLNIVDNIAYIHNDDQADLAGASEDSASAGSKEIHYLSIDTVIPNPYQPRKTFTEESLAELSSSIREFGVIQPILVRSIGDNRFELIAGERRLRASKLAGLTEIPVIVKEFSDKETAELAMIENLQREDLHYLEEAEGFQQLIANFGFTQEQLAQRVGKSQSTIANKMRLLKLSPELRSVLVQENLTERHARSLLKVENESLQMNIVDTIRQNKLNVRESEELIDQTLADISREKTKADKPRQNVVKIIKDVRIFLNTIKKVVVEMKKTGLDIQVKEEQDDDTITIRLSIPKRRSK